MEATSVDKGRREREREREREKKNEYKETPAHTKNTKLLNKIKKKNPHCKKRKKKEENNNNNNPRTCIQEPRKCNIDTYQSEGKRRGN